MKYWAACPTAPRRLTAWQRSDWMQRDRAMVLTALLAGLRADELVPPHRRGAVIHVRGKGGKDRRVPQRTCSQPESNPVVSPSRPILDWPVDPREPIALRIRQSDRMYASGSLVGSTPAAMRAARWRITFWSLGFETLSGASTPIAAAFATIASLRFSRERIRSGSPMPDHVSLGGHP
jgi:hypothetical protein